MATNGKSLPHRIQRWHHASEGARDLLADLPFIQPDLDELRDIAEEIHVLQAQHAQHVAQSQALTAKIRALAKRGDHIRGRVGAAVKSRFGFDSTELIQCGFKPHPQVKRNHMDEQVEKEREGAGEP
jgi:hypothetical protein